MIHIDTEGRLWHQGAEMIHPGINSMILEHIQREEDGRYTVVYRDQRCWVEVEDTALVVQKVTETEDGRALNLLLSDGVTEVLQPELLWLDENNVMYTKVRAMTLPARFLRRAYYQLAEFIVETDLGFALRIGGADHHLVPGRPE